MPHFATIYRLADALGIEGEELIEFQPSHDRNSHHTRQTQRDRPSELLVSYPEGLNNETGSHRQKDPGLDAIVTAYY